ncbi:MAG: hypothetical protein IKH13_00980 [Clostridia bacterium]|nr:hypothetical protein [Clostridia bacterium]
MANLKTAEILCFLFKLYAYIALFFGRGSYKDKKEKTPPTENRFQPVGCLFLPRAFPRMSGTDLVGDNAIRIMDLPAGHLSNNAGYHPV